jgi:hypothetical protein
MTFRRYVLNLLAFLCCALAPCQALFVPLPDATHTNQPWFTGPLLTPSARAVSIGHVNLEPYLFWTIINGRYDHNWSVLPAHKFYQVNPLLIYKIGILEGVDFGGNIQGFYNRTEGESSWAFADLPVGFEIQLVGEHKDSWIPFVKLTLQEVFPTGKYQKLHPHKLGTDIGGQGAFATNIAITMSKLFTFPQNHFMNVRGNFSLTLPCRTHVKGLNTYGGDSETHGHVDPGTSFVFQAAAEYNLTQRWALALDLQAVFAGRSHFKGHTDTPVGTPSSIQLSAAPAIEYNWSENMGVIAGSWFTFAGRNSARFVSFAIAYNFYY